MSRIRSPWWAAWSSSASLWWLPWAILVLIGAVGLLSGIRPRRRRRVPAGGPPTLAERAVAGRRARERAERSGHGPDGRTQ